jgi:excisionase family DNA binding protein
MDSEIITTQEAAEILGRDESTIRRMCINGVIPAEKWGPRYRGIWRIERSVFMKMLPQLKAIRTGPKPKKSKNNA